jgi:hypothetical protein
VHPAKAVVCAFGDIKVLDAKEGYAPSIAPSALKRRASYRTDVLIIVKSFRQISENLQISKKTRIFAM